MKKTAVFLAIIFTTISANAQLSNGNYTIRLAATGKALDAAITDLNINGCIVHLWSFNKKASQIWQIKNVDTKKQDCFDCGDYTIQIAATGKYLDADPAHLKENDCTVRLWEKLAVKYYSQRWTIKKLSGNKYQITLSASGKALDADGPNINRNDCIVHLWDARADGFKTQTWIIEKL